MFMSMDHNVYRNKHYFELSFTVIYLILGYFWDTLKQILTFVSKWIILWSPRWDSNPYLFPLERKVFYLKIQGHVRGKLAISKGRFHRLGMYWSLLLNTLNWYVNIWAKYLNKKNIKKERKSSLTGLDPLTLGVKA